MESCNAKTQTNRKTSSLFCVESTVPTASLGILSLIWFWCVPDPYKSSEGMPFVPVREELAP
jgi:hypothetical protein